MCGLYCTGGGRLGCLATTGEGKGTGKNLGPRVGGGGSYTVRSATEWKKREKCSGLCFWGCSVHVGRLGVKDVQMARRALGGKSKGTFGSSTKSRQDIMLIKENDRAV